LPRCTFLSSMQLSSFFHIVFARTKRDQILQLTARFYTHKKAPAAIGVCVLRFETRTKTCMFIFRCISRPIAAAEIQVGLICERRKRSNNTKCVFAQAEKRFTTLCGDRAAINKYIIKTASATMGMVERKRALIFAPIVTMHKLLMHTGENVLSDVIPKLSCEMLQIYFF